MLLRVNLLKSYFTLCLLLFCVTLSNSAEIYKNNFSVGFNFGTLLNVHDADFNSFEGMYNCGTYNDKLNFGFLASLDFNYKISTTFDLYLSTTYADRSTTLSFDEMYRMYNTETDKLQDVISRYNLISQIKNIEIGFGINYLLEKDFIDGPLKLTAGTKLYIPYISTFEQNKEAVSPDGYMLEYMGNSLLLVGLSAGDIPERYNPGFGLVLGLKNYLKAGNFNHFTQSIQIDYCFSNIVKDLDWKHYSINFMLGYEFDLFSRKEEQLQQFNQEYQKSPVKDSATFIPVIEENLKPKIGFDKILHDFSIEKGNELLCTSPKVTSVFFDKHSNEIPSSYLVKDNSLDSYSEPISMHRNILFDILDILSSNSKTSIDIIAYSSTDEADTTTLKKKRLDAITHFFEKNGIDNNRISVSKKQIFSNETYDTGKEENRRVDIIIKGDILTNFVSDFYLNNVKGYTKIIPDTGHILFPSRIKVEDKYQQYRTSSKDMLFTYIIPSDIYDEYFTYEIKYLDDTKSDTTFSIKKESMKVNMFDLRTDNFLAVLTFDYNSAELSNIAKQTLRELVRFLPENMTIQISGSTDSTGTESRNAVLTKMRASNAKRYMESISYPKILKFEETVDSSRFSNSSPVGRFLNRSIRIRLKKD